MSDGADLARAARGTVWSPQAAAPAVNLAADELAHYLGRIVGRTPARATVPGDGNQVWLSGHRPEQAPTRQGESSVEAADTHLAIGGAAPRDVLSAVYRVLAETGCRWSPRGRAHEDVPTSDRARLRVASSVHRPAFARRAYASDLTTWHYSMPERYTSRLPQDLAFIDWMAKTGATGWLFIRHAHDDRWLLPELTAPLRARGLAVEWGGHGLVEWLPRARFATHPEYFPMQADGSRTDMGNCCTSSAAGLAVIVEGVLASRGATQADDVHLWGLDLFGGGWCHCDTCRLLTASDQALQLANHIAACLPANERVFHLAYHDTIHCPRLAPHPRVWAEFAPRERCYAHALDDPECHLNPRYRTALEEHLLRFDGRVDVFEYYADAILFGGCAVPLTEVIERDLAYYHRAGVGGVSCLTFGRYSQLAYGANLAAFATGTHDPLTSARGRRDHCVDAFGPAASAAEAYLAALEREMSRVLFGGDLKLPPRHQAAAMALQTRQGVDWPSWQALAALPATARQQAEVRLLDYTLGTLDGLRRVVVDLHDLDGALRDLQTLASTFATADLADVGTWGAVDLPLIHGYYDAGLRGLARPQAPFADDEG